MAETPLKASSVRQLPELPTRDAIDVLQKVHGFYQVKNEDDLRQCMEGLNALFNRAIDLEMDVEAAPARKPRAKKAPRSSASTPRSPRSAAYLDRAAEFLAATDPNVLSSLLQSPDMRHALNVTGIRPEDLVPKAQEDFIKERDRAWHVPPEVAAMRFKHYEKSRKSSVALLLQVAESQEVPQSDDAKDFDRELDHERRLLEEMIRGRLRYEKVLEREADKIRRKRAKFLDKVQENGVFQRRGDEPPAFKDHVHAERSEANRLKMERVRAQRQLLEQTKQENADARRRYEQSRAAQIKKEKDDQLKLKRVLGDERERKRLQVVEDARELDRQRRECIELAVHEREAHLEATRKRALHSTMLVNERKRLEQHAREVTVQRAKNVQSFKTNEASKKLHATTERVDNLKEIRRAILQERNRIHVLTRSRKAHCRNLRDEIDVLPGPGEYSVRWADHTRGGYIGHAVAVETVPRTPGPGAYEELGTIADAMRTSGHAFPKSRSLETLEGPPTPGPGQYMDPLRPQKALGPSFPLATLTPFDLSLRHAAELPAPCDYSATTGSPSHSKATKAFKRSLHAMTTSYLHACKGAGEVMIDKDIHALEVEAPE